MNVYLALQVCTLWSKTLVNHNSTETDIWCKAFIFVRCFFFFSLETVHVNWKSTNKGIDKVLFLLGWHLLVPERYYYNTWDKCFIVLYDMVCIHLHVSTQTYIFEMFLVHFIRKKCKKWIIFLSKSIEAKAKIKMHWTWDLLDLQEEWKQEN